MAATPAAVLVKVMAAATGASGVHEAAPAREVKPSLQGLHVDPDVAPVAFEKVPAAQARHAALLAAPGKEE